MDKKTKIVVTGATGFLGGALAEQLLEQGYDIIPIGRTPSKNISKKLLNRLVICDLATDDLQEDVEADVVIHLAGVQHSQSNQWADYYLNNVETLKPLLSITKKHFVYISTGSVYGSNGTENPENYYGLSKLICEKLLKIESANEDAVKITILRFPEIFGVNRQGGVVQEFLSSALADKEIVLYSEGRLFRNFLYVDDAVNSIITLLHSLDTLDRFECFDVGSRDSIRLLELAQRIVRNVGSKSKISLSSKKARYNSDFFFEGSHALSKFGYEATRIRDSIDKYLRKLDVHVNKY